MDDRDTLKQLREEGTPEMERLSRLTQVLADHVERQGAPGEHLAARATALERSGTRHEDVVRAWHVSGEFDPSIGGSDLGVVVIDRGRFQFSNATFDAWFGYAPEEVRRLGPLEIAVHDDWNLISEQFRRRLSGEADTVQYAFRGRRADGEIIELVCHCTGVRNGGRPMIVGTFTDVTDQVRHECKLIAMQDELREQSLRDEVTGLWNRHYVDEMLDERLASAHASGEPVCLIVADIDDFEQITEQHGREAAADVLRGFAEFLQRQFRPSDVFCRYGDDEFVVGLLSCPHSVGLGRALQLRSLAVTITTRTGVDVPVTASYGSASLPRNGQCSAEVLEAAHAALRATD